MCLQLSPAQMLFRACTYLYLEITGNFRQCVVILHFRCHESQRGREDVRDASDRISRLKAGSKFRLRWARDIRAALSSE